MAHPAGALRLPVPLPVPLPIPVMVAASAQDPHSAPLEEESGPPPETQPTHPPFAPFAPFGPRPALQQSLRSSGRTQVDDYDRRDVA